MNSRLQFVHDRGLKQVVSFPEYHVTVLVGISGHNMGWNFRLQHMLDIRSCLQSELISTQSRIASVNLPSLY